MASNVQVEVMKARKAAAKSALRYFKEQQEIKSTNNVFAMTSDKDALAQMAYRVEAGWFPEYDHLVDSKHKTGHTMVQAYENAMSFNLGNCGEKSLIVYGSLESNPRIHDSVVSYCHSVGYDHAFCIVSSKAIMGKVGLSALGSDAIIVDGWTGDWYFPNLPFTSAKWYGLSNTPNPRQLVIRAKVALHKIEAAPVTISNNRFQSRKGQTKDSLLERYS